MEQSTNVALTNMNAATKDAPTKSEVKGSVLCTGQSQYTKPAVMKDAPSSLRREVSVSGMEQSSNFAVTRTALTKLYKGVFVRDMVPVPRGL